MERADIDPMRAVEIDHGHVRRGAALQLALRQAEDLRRPAGHAFQEVAERDRAVVIEAQADRQQGLEADGGLLVELDNGDQKVIRAADISSVRSAETITR